MSEEIKLTKSGLREEQQKLSQLQAYLPTLQLKKAMLQAEVNSVLQSIEIMEKEWRAFKEEIEGFSSILEKASEESLLDFAQVLHVEKHYENLTGVEIPSFDRVIFPEEEYSLFDTPPWGDQVLMKIRSFVSDREKIRVEREKLHVLEKELVEVSIRVNLFEKILIPSILGKISKIKIFLGDQALAAVAQAKVAKKKIFAKKKALAEGKI